MYLHFFLGVDECMRCISLCEKISVDKQNSSGPADWGSQAIHQGPNSTGPPDLGQPAPSPLTTLARGSLPPRPTSPGRVRQHSRQNNEGWMEGGDDGTN